MEKVYFIRHKDDVNKWLKNYQQFGNIIHNCIWVDEMKYAKQFDDVLIARFISNALGNCVVFAIETDV